MISDRGVPALSWQCVTFICARRTNGIRPWVRLAGRLNASAVSRRLLVTQTAVWPEEPYRSRRINLIGSTTDRLQLLHVSIWIDGSEHIRNARSVEVVPERHQLTTRFPDIARAVEVDS